MNKFVVFFIVIVVVSSCKYHKRDYYNTGELKHDFYINSDSQIDGFFKAYHKNGKMASISFYEKNLSEGVEKEYDTFGHLSKILNFKRARLNGLEICFYPNMDTSLICNWVLNKRFGDMKSYQQNGILCTYNCFDFKEKIFFHLTIDNKIDSSNYGIAFSNNVMFVVNDTISFIKDISIEKIIDLPVNSRVKINLAVCNPPFSNTKVIISSQKIFETIVGGIGNLATREFMFDKKGEFAEA